MLNPYINYPFDPTATARLADYSSRAHATGLKLKLYYTIRNRTGVQAAACGGGGAGPCGSRAALTSACMRLGRATHPPTPAPYTSHTPRTPRFHAHPRTRTHTCRLAHAHSRTQASCRTTPTSCGCCAPSETRCSCREAAAAPRGTTSTSAAARETTAAAPEATRTARAGRIRSRTAASIRRCATGRSE